MSGLFAGTSLEQPVTCHRCKQTHAKCACPRCRKTGKVLEPADQPLRIRREQRRGKYVTVITGFAGRSDRSDDLPAILKKLKATLGTGGTLDTTNPEAPIVELQGDHRDKMVEHFKAAGYPAKPAGG